MRNAILLYVALCCGLLASPCFAEPQISAPVIVQFTGIEGKLVWFTEPPIAKTKFVETQIPVGKTHEGETILGPAWRLVWDNHPRVVVIVVGDHVYARHVIPAAGELGPGPIVDPDPIVDPIVDPPDPKPQPKVTEVVVVSETGKPSPAQAVVLRDTTWPKHLRDQGFKVQVLDMTRLPERLKPLADKARDGPVVCLVAGDDVDGARAFPLPVDVAALYKLLEEKINE
jgi:hypothetical protein